MKKFLFLLVPLIGITFLGIRGKIPYFQKPFVTIKFRAQLGNQLFQAAALYALAKDHGVEAIFPEKAKFIEKEGLAVNIKKVMHRLPFKNVSRAKISKVYKQKVFRPFEPIEYTPNMRLAGFFESEKYFKKYKEEIIELFAPSEEILSYLHEKYRDLIEHPNTVAMHVRTFYKDFYLNDDDYYESFPAPDVSYFEKAVELFDEDALIVIFSDHIPWCKKHLSHLPRNLIFIENEAHYHDFYLMSLMKNVITSNSSFSWWAAYINRNPDKKVVARTPWCMRKERLDNDIIVDDWIRIPGNPNTPIPEFDEPKKPSFAK